jgi:hypothetical protein
MFFALLFTACNSPLKDAVKTYEWQAHELQVKKLRFSGQWKPFYATDSLNILKDEYDIFYATKINALDNYLFQLKTNLEQTEAQLDSIQSPIMLKYFKQAIDGIAYRVKKVEAIKVIYQTQPEKTQCGVWLLKIDHYKQLDSLLLGYSQKAKISGTQGHLSMANLERTYFWSIDKKELLGEITLPQSAP